MPRPPAPAILAQPQDITIVLTESDTPIPVQFRVEAEGATSFEWFRSRTDSLDPIPGATTPVLSLPDARVEAGMGYLAMVSGEGGRTVSRIARISFKVPVRFLAASMVAPDRLRLRFARLDGAPNLNAVSLRVETAEILAGARTVWQRVGVPLVWSEGALQCDLAVDPSFPTRFYRIVEP